MIDEIRRILQSGVCLSDFSDKCKNDGACKKCENEALEKLIADHDKQIKADLIREVEKKVKAEVIEEIVKKITIYIDDMKRFYKESQDSSFLCAIAEAQKIRRIIHDMEKEQK